MNEIEVLSSVTFDNTIYGRMWLKSSSRLGSIQGGIASREIWRTSSLVVRRAIELMIENYCWLTEYVQD